MTPARAHLRVGLLLALLSLAACGGGGSETSIVPPGPPGPPPGADPARISGTIEVYLPQVESLLESEPNDVFEQAHFLGEFRAGRTASVVGHADSAAGGDPADGYRFLAPERVRITLDLEFQGSGPAEFTVGVFDFSGLQYVEVFSSDTSPVTGQIHAKGIVDLVVAPSQGEGDYALTLSAHALGNRIQESEPNDDLYDGQYLGEVLEDDVIVFRGNAHFGQDPFDSVTIACPSTVKLDLFLFIPDTGLPEPAELDLLVYDITGGEDEPPLLDHAIWSTGRATTEVEVPAGSLIQIFVSAFLDGATYIFVLRGQEPDEAGALTTAIVPRGREPYSSAGIAPVADYAIPRAPIVPGEAVVRVAPNGASNLASDLARRGCRVVTTVPEVCSRVRFELPASLGDEDRTRFTLRAVQCLARPESLSFAEPNHLLQPHVEPDDPNYNLQWHYPLLRLPRAWDITTGDSDVIVAVIDTGQANHPDLAGRQIAGYDFISIAAIARDGDGVDPDPTDEGDRGLPGGLSTFHGTHVAGTIGAVTDNTTGVAGVTWQTRIMHLRALGMGGGTSFDVANAILYAAGLDNSSGTVPAERADIINMSLGGSQPDQVSEDAIAAARGEGVVIFASSGNAGTSTPQYPASYDGVISVGAVDLVGARAYYSSYGSTLDIMAPGGDVTADANGDSWPDGVLSTRMVDNVWPPTPVYTFFQGTSMACPHAAGVAALMFAEDAALTPDEVESILKATARDAGPAGVDEEYGHGLIDAYGAILSVIGAGPPDIPPLLDISATAVSLAPEEESRRILITNSGGQILTVDPPVIVVHTPTQWLSATLLPPTIGGANTSGVELTVDRTGLADGVYFGRVVLDSDGGSESIQVLMRVQTGPPAPPDIDIFVRVVDVATGEVVRQVFVNPTGSLEFTLDGIPAGTYRLEAGSDSNGNGVSCEEGELCGAYPLLESPIFITLQPGEDRGPFVFTVSPPATLAASTER
jgi:subtilisin family serine protease